MRKLYSVIRIMAIVSGALPLTAVAQSATGVWKTIDDDSKQAKALIQISEEPNGELRGQVIKLLQRPDAMCDQCHGELKGKPVHGMTILWGLSKEDDHRWSGGHILDPKNGKVYRARITLSNDGQQLDVRGFLGIALLGRSQIWQRQ